MLVKYDKSFIVVDIQNTLINMYAYVVLILDLFNFIILAV